MTKDRKLYNEQICELKAEVCRQKELIKRLQRKKATTSSFSEEANLFEEENNKDNVAENISTTAFETNHMRRLDRDGVINNQSTNALDNHKDAL